MAPPIMNMKKYLPGLIGCRIGRRQLNTIVSNTEAKGHYQGLPFHPYNENFVKGMHAARKINCESVQLKNGKESVYCIAGKPLEKTSLIMPYNLELLNTVT